jgi:hypothetical protein
MVEPSTVAFGPTTTARRMTENIEVSDMCALNLILYVLSTCYGSTSIFDVCFLINTYSDDDASERNQTKKPK